MKSEERVVCDRGGRKMVFFSRGFKHSCRQGSSSQGERVCPGDASHQDPWHSSPGGPAPHQGRASLLGFGTVLRGSIIAYNTSPKGRVSRLGGGE